MPDAVLNPPLPADIGRAIRTVKTQLRRQIGDVATVFAEAEEAMRAEATTVAADREAGGGPGRGRRCPGPGRTRSAPETGAARRS